jgi:hypothetical protein
LQDWNYAYPVMLGQCWNPLPEIGGGAQHDIGKGASGDLEGLCIDAETRHNKTVRLAVCLGGKRCAGCLAQQVAQPHEWPNRSYLGRERTCRNGRWCRTRRLRERQHAD